MKIVFENQHDALTFYNKVVVPLLMTVGALRAAHCDALAAELEAHAQVMNAEYFHFINESMAALAAPSSPSSPPPAPPPETTTIPKQDARIIRALLAAARSVLADPDSEAVAALRKAADAAELAVKKTKHHTPIKENRE